MSLLNLTPIYQEDPTGCVLACIATVTQIPYEEVKRTFCYLFGELEDGVTSHQEKAILAKLGWGHSIIEYDRYSSLHDNKTFILTVPSLNNTPHGAHRIVMQIDSDGNRYIHDPNGKEGLKRYGTAEGETSVICFFEPTEIIYGK